MLTYGTTLRSVWNFDHLQQQLRYIYQLGLISESGICKSVLFVFYTASHIHISARLHRLYFAPASASSSAFTARGRHTCTMGARWLYTTSWVYGALSSGKQSRCRQPAPPRTQHRLYRALVWTLCHALLIR